MIDTALFVRIYFVLVILFGWSLSAQPAVASPLWIASKGAKSFILIGASHSTSLPLSSWVSTRTYEDFAASGDVWIESVQNSDAERELTIQYVRTHSHDNHFHLCEHIGRVACGALFERLRVLGFARGIEDLEHLLPWAAAVQLSLSPQEMGPTNGDRPRSAVYCVDCLIAERFRLQGKEVFGLEHSWEQAASLAGLDIKSQLQLLNAYLSFEGPSQTEKVEQAWVKDNVLLAAQILAAGPPFSVESAKHGLIVDRNRSWVVRLDHLAGPGQHLVVVGLAHLALEPSLPSLFREAGYSVIKVGGAY